MDWEEQRNAYKTSFNVYECCAHAQRLEIGSRSRGLERYLYSLVGGKRDKEGGGLLGKNGPISGKSCTTPCVPS